jgi:ketosteroid isomerase-like protein
MVKEAHMTDATATTDVTQIRVLLREQAAAVEAGDAARARSFCAPEMVEYGLAPPLQVAGPDALDPAGLAAWLATWRGPVRMDVGEPAVCADGGVAFCYGLTHLQGVKVDGGPVDLWFRSTIGLRRTPAGWRIVHQHDSTPFYMDGSDRAALDLRP